MSFLTRITSCCIGNCNKELIVTPRMLNAAIPVVAVIQHAVLNNVDIACIRYDLPVPAVPHDHK